MDWIKVVLMIGVACLFALNGYLIWRLYKT
jgi:hypothetical protein